MCGVLNISETEFFDTSPAFFFGRLSGFYKHLDEVNKLEWIKTRWLALITVQPHVKKRLKPKDLMVFDWEKVEEISEIDIDRIKNRFKKLLQDGVKKS